MVAKSPSRSAFFRFAATSIGLPVVVIGLASWFFMSYRLDVISQQVDFTQDTVIEALETRLLVERARHVQEIVAAHMRDRMTAVMLWAHDPLIREAAREAASLHEAEGLANLSPEALEARAPPARNLQAFPRIERRLKAYITTSPSVGELFFTDVHGLNVAATNLTSDMLQSDEEWWQQAWLDGVHIGRVEFDDSAAIWAIPVGYRLDGANGGPVGVLKAVISVDFAQEIADDMLEYLVEESSVQIVDGGGLLIADTASGHSPDKLMKEEFGIAGGESAPALTRAEPQGFFVTGNVYTAYSRSPEEGRRDEGEFQVSQAIEGLGWTVLVHEPAGHAFSTELTVFDSLVNTLRQWRVMLLLAFVGIAVASLLIAAGLAAARRSDRDGA